MTEYKIEKSKNVAIVLSIFFDCFTWLYTYKYNSDKFLIGVLIKFVVVPISGFFYFPLGLVELIILWLWALIDTINTDESFFKDYYKVSKEIKYKEVVHKEISKLTEKDKGDVYFLIGFFILLIILGFMVLNK